jgi:hypothetical protein
MNVHLVDQKYSDYVISQQKEHVKSSFIIGCSAIPLSTSDRQDFDTTINN